MMADGVAGGIVGVGDDEVGVDLIAAGNQLLEHAGFLQHMQVIYLNLIQITWCICQS